MDVSPNKTAALVVLAVIAVAVVVVVVVVVVVAVFSPAQRTEERCVQWKAG